MNSFKLSGNRNGKNQLKTKVQKRINTRTERKLFLFNEQENSKNKTAKRKELKPKKK